MNEEQNDKSKKMINANLTLSRERVLLNLKWFVDRVLRSFEAKLENQTAENIKQTIGSRNNRDSLEQNSNRLALNTDVQISRKFYGDSLAFSSPRSSLRLGKTFPESPKQRIKNFLKSPKSILRTHTQKRTNSSGDVSMPKKFPFSSTCQTPDRYELSNSNFDSCESSIFQESESGFDFSKRYRLVVLLERTMFEDRRASILGFAEHLCLIYEYQIGMLRGLKSVHASADYIADVILKAFRNGLIQSLSPYDLNPSLLFDVQCRPRSASKLIKTIPLTVTGEQLTWKVGDIWTMPGLRHNEVGGENCHNLSIVTHFLSKADSTSFANTLRPDLYGYRNLIVSMSGGFPSGVSNSVPYFDIFKSDAEIITKNSIRTGAKYDASPSLGVQGTEKDENSQSSDSNVGQQKTIINSASSLRQYLHRAYRPIFFLIFDRPTVVEHLTVCDSFAAFCQRQFINSVMFVNQETEVFQENNHPSLYHNFSLYNVSSSSLEANFLKNNPKFDPINKKSNLSANCTGLKNNFIVAHENRGFVC